MIIIEKDIIKNVGQLKYEVENVRVISFYDNITMTFPLVTIEEQPSNNGIYNQNKPMLMQNTYIVEVYTKQTKIGTEISKKRDVAMSIMKTVDEYLTKVMGFKMIGNVTIAPYQDESVCRAVARYTANINEKTNLIYRNYR